MRAERAPAPGTAPRDRALGCLLGQAGTLRAPGRTFLFSRLSICHHQPHPPHSSPHSFSCAEVVPEPALSLLPSANCRASPDPQRHTCAPQWPHLCRHRPPCSRRPLSPGPVLAVCRSQGSTYALWDLFDPHKSSVRQIMQELRVNHD